MGQGPSFTIEDYANRIELYLNQQGGKASTEQIIKEVKGTNHRLADGLVWLLTMGVVSMEDKKSKVIWSLIDIYKES